MAKPCNSYFFIAYANFVNLSTLNLSNLALLALLVLKLKINWYLQHKFSKHKKNPQILKMKTTSAKYNHVVCSLKALTP